MTRGPSAARAPEADGAVAPSARPRAGDRSPRATRLRPVAFAVLRRLHAGRHTSGEQLARELGVSRSTVWSAVRSLVATGVEIHSGLGQGYRLQEPPSWIDGERVLAALGPAARRLQLQLLDHCASTSSELARRADAGAEHGSVLLAEWQSAGRGRRGRAWSCPPGAGLTFSLLWRFERPARDLAGLSLAVGLAIAEAMRTLGLRDITLKWPNDVLHRGRKLAGVLVEVRGDMLGPTAAVIGIGLNVQLPAAALRAVGQPATDLSRAGLAEPDRNAILAALLSELATTLSRFEREGFAGLRPQWQAHSAGHRQTVRVVLPDGEVVRGRMLGVDDQGALRIDTGQSVRRIFSGEFDPRPPRGGGEADGARQADLGGALEGADACE